MRIGKSGWELFMAWLAFHLKNPIVWEIFHAAAFAVLAKEAKGGKRRISARLIYEDMRMHKRIDTVDAGHLYDGRELKLNDHHITCYARLLLQKYPHLFDRIEIRTSKVNPYMPTIFEGCKPWKRKRKTKCSSTPKSLSSPYAASVSGISTTRAP